MGENVPPPHIHSAHCVKCKACFLFFFVTSKETTCKTSFPDKQLFSTWASKKEICFGLFSCLAPCQKCKITKQLMAPRSRCPGSVDNPTNKPDLAIVVCSAPLYSRSHFTFLPRQKLFLYCSSLPPTPAVSCQAPNLTRNLSTNIFFWQSQGRRPGGWQIDFS